MIYNVRYVRIQRESTDSMMTYKLPSVMDFNDAQFWLEVHMPGWELLMGCMNNPDH